MTKNTRKLVYCAVIAAVYAAVTMVLAPISYGSLQFRLSEVLCILPFFFPPAAEGLFIGCAIANLMSSAGMLDIVFGSLATLLAGLCTAAIGRRARKATAAPDRETKTVGWGRCIAACAMPVLFNGPIIGAVLSYTLMPAGEFWLGVAVLGGQVALGEAAVMFAAGLPIMRLVIKNRQMSGFFINLNVGKR